MPKAVGAGAGRVEVFTGARRRRAWSAEDKASIVAESHSGGGSVCDVARRHGLTPAQLFSWRRAARRKSVGPKQEAAFVPAIMAADDTPKAAETGKPASPILEIEVGGAHVWVWHDVDVGLATAVIRALKAGR
jgi:transposase